MATLTQYRTNALKAAKTKALGDGYVAQIPRFQGLLALGATRKEALVELSSALEDWIDASLSKGVDLPSLLEAKGEPVPA